jgi:hypothetical protein
VKKYLKGEQAHPWYEIIRNGGRNRNRGYDIVAGRQEIILMTHVLDVGLLKSFSLKARGLKRSSKWRPGFLWLKIKPSFQISKRSISFKSQDSQRVILERLIYFYQGLCFLSLVGRNPINSGFRGFLPQKINKKITAKNKNRRYAYAYQRSINPKKPNQRTGISDTIKSFNELSFAKMRSGFFMIF